MDAFENVHNTYDLTKLIRSIKHAEERDKEERELKNRIESYKSRRLERKAAKVLWIMQKVLGFAMGVMTIAMPESAVIAVPLACAFLFTRNILSIRPVVVDADGGVIEFERGKV